MVNVKRTSGRRILADAARDSLLLADVAPVCRSLRSSSLFIDSKAQLTESLCVTLLANLRTHYETFYGKESARPRPVVIPSMSLFLDFKVGGSVHVILATLLEGATIRDLLPLEKLFDQPANLLLPLLFEIEKNLHLHGLISRPVVFLNRVPVGIINKLSKITLEHGGRVVHSEERATHVVDWNEDADAAGGDLEDNARAVCMVSSEEPNDTIRLHFPFYPDAFDELLPVSQLPGPLDAADQASLVTALAGRRRFNVSCRFILDVEIFNEWGNEADYDMGTEDDSELVDQTQAAVPTTRKAGKSRRKTAAPAPTKVKETLPAQAQTFTEKILPDTLPPSLAGEGVRVLDLTQEAPAVRTLQSSLPPSDSTHTSASQAVKDAVQTTDAGAAPATAMASTGGSEEGNARKRARNWLEEDASSASRPSPFAMTGPLDLKWLRLDSISDFERRYLSDLLPAVPGNASPSTTDGAASTASFTPAEVFYRDCRNALLQATALNPGQYLSATEARRKISGDASKIIRIHAFLDAVGAINSKVKMEARPPAVDEDWIWHTKRMELVALCDRNYHHALPKTESRKETRVQFTRAMDDALLHAIQQSKGRWEEITAAMQTVASPAPTSTQCLHRFLELQLEDETDKVTMGTGQTPSTAATSSNMDVCEEKKEKEGSSAAEGARVNGNAQEEGPVCVGGRKEIERWAARAIRQLQALESSLYHLRIHRTALQAQTAHSETPEQKMDVSEPTEAHPADKVEEKDVVSMTESLRTQVQEELQGLAETLTQRSNGFFEDIASLRLTALESKMQVFSRLEALLQLEREKVEIDKRDVLLKQLSAGINPLAGGLTPSMGQAGGGLPSYNSSVSLANYR